MDKLLKRFIGFVAVFLSSVFLFVYAFRSDMWFLAVGVIAIAVAGFVCSIFIVHCASSGKKQLVE
jgi:1,4-dihydroxy-2-naphthoate octaprenyltransferase